MLEMFDATTTTIDFVRTKILRPIREANGHLRVSINNRDYTAFVQPEMSS